MGLWMAFFFLVFHPASLWMDNWLPALVPVLTPLLYGLLPTIAIYFTSFCCRSFSIEYNFTPSLGMDIPSELHHDATFGIGLLLFFQRHFHGNFSNYRHPITAILLASLCMGFWFHPSTLSFQLFLPRWRSPNYGYIIPFYFLAYMFWKEIKTLPAWLSMLFICWLFHDHDCFVSAFSKRLFIWRCQFCSYTSFRNHVNYARIIVIFCPICGVGDVVQGVDCKNDISGHDGFICGGHLFSYTRAAILSMVLAVVIYYIIKKMDDDAYCWPPTDL